MTLQMVFPLFMCSTVGHTITMTSRRVLITFSPDSPIEIPTLSENSLYTTKGITFDQISGHRVSVALTLRIEGHNVSSTDSVLREDAVAMARISWYC